MKKSHISESSNISILKKTSTGFTGIIFCLTLLAGFTWYKYTFNEFKLRPSDVTGDNQFTLVSDFSYVESHAAKYYAPLHHNLQIKFTAYRHGQEQTSNVQFNAQDEGFNRLELFTVKEEGVLKYNFQTNHSGATYPVSETEEINQNYSQFNYATLTTEWLPIYIYVGTAKMRIAITSTDTIEDFRKKFELVVVIYAKVSRDKKIVTAQVSKYVTD